MYYCTLLFLCCVLPISPMALNSFGPSTVFSVSESQSEISAQGFDYVHADAHKGGTLRLAAFGSFNNLNPFIMSGVAASGLGHTYESLGMQSYDALDTIYAQVAETFALDHERGTFTVVLKDYVRFHDGTLVTSADIKATYSALTQEGHPAYHRWS